MAEFQETGQEPMEVDGTNCASENGVDMETGSRADNVTTTKQELMESDDKESVVVTDSGKMENSGDIRKESSETPEELSNLHQEENKDIDQEKKDIDQLQDDRDDQERSGDAVNQSQGNQSSLQEASGSDQKSTQNDQAGSEGKFSNHPLGNKPEQPSDQSGKDHETVDDQMEATSQQDVQNVKTQNANPDLITDQDEVKSDQDEESPSTPPHMTSASVDSQATEIIGSDSSHSNGDDEHNGQQSSEDEAKESQYGRPWYQFWGSSHTPAKKRKVKITRKPSVWSARDTLAYRDGYPGKRDNKRIDKNLKFYRNQISSYPFGDYIDVIHEKWWGNYQHLEYNHSYIQWLFPIREQGLNMHAEVLQLHEAKAICSDPVAHGRILKSYEMMLDFYGMKLCDEKIGEVERAENWKERFHHLNHSMHNYLRITRILKCLGEMKLEHLKAPFVRYVLHEIISEQTLYNCLDSCINYWLQVIKNDQEREDLLEYAESLARETRSTTTTTAKSQAAAEGVTKKNTDLKGEAQLKETQSTKKETQSTKEETQPTKKETQSTKKETKKETQPIKKETKKETQSTKEETQPTKKETQSTKEETQPTKKETQSTKEETRPTKKETQSTKKETQPTQPNKGKQQKNESQAQQKKPLTQSKLKFFKRK